MARKYGRRDASSAYKIFSLLLWIELRCDFPAAGKSRSGSAWLGRSQKDGLPTYRGIFHYRSKAINSRTGEGQPGRCPF